MKDELPPELSRDEILQSVLSAATEVLGPDGITPEADFFGLGGESLSAVTLIVKLEESLGRELSVELVFDHPILGDLAVAIGAR